MVAGQDLHPVRKETDFVTYRCAASCSNQLQPGAGPACRHAAARHVLVEQVEAHCMYCPAEDEVGGKRKLEDAAMEAAKRPRTDGQPPFLPGSTHHCLFMSAFAMPAAH